VGEALEITIKDWGNVFDPMKVPEPNFEQPLEKIKPRGAGVMLIKKIMDEVKYNFSPQGNVLVMIKIKSE
jgi:serine/threonine-protein kinase RsbW